MSLNNKKDLEQTIRDLRTTKNAAADAGDLLSIHKKILERKPRFILELGPGTSTIAICQAIAKIQEADSGYKPKFVAVEENEEWLDYHKASLPEQYRPLVEFYLRNRIESTIPIPMAFHTPITMTFPYTPMILSIWMDRFLRFWGRQHGIPRTWFA